MIRKLIHFSDTHEAAACLEDWRACLDKRIVGFFNSRVIRRSRYDRTLIEPAVERMLDRGHMLEPSDSWQPACDSAFSRKVTDALSKNFSDENYNQDALAYDLAMSRVQLYRKMKSEMKTTPGEFIRNFRIRQAEIMLRETGKTVQEIMYDCGFHNKAYFYREFSRIHNCSPKDFRHRR